MTNRFKGLDLIDRVPEQLWTEVCDIVQEAVIKTIPKKKKCRKAKWLSEEALQIAKKRQAGVTHKKDPVIRGLELLIPPSNHREGEGEVCRLSAIKILRSNLS